MGQKINKRHIPGILLLTLVVVFLFSCGIILFWSQNNQHSVIKVTIEPGSTLTHIANTLYDKNIISDFLVNHISYKPINNIPFKFIVINHF